MPPRARAWRIADRAVIALFLAAVGVPLAGIPLGLDLMPEGNDMRHLEPVPPVALDLQTLRLLPRRWEAYVADHFGFRGPLVRALSVARVCGLGVASSPNVVLGHGSWLFYSHVPAGSDYEEVRPFTAGELARWGRVLERRRRWLAGRGCHYILFIPPDKQTIYPEHLDARLRPRHAGCRLDQLVEHLRAHTGVTVLDVREPLRRARERERVYHVTDSHWNDRGAFVGYQELARLLSGWFPRVRPRERSEVAEVVREREGGDAAGLMDLRDLLREEDLELVPRVPPRARLSDSPPLPPEGVYLGFGPPRAWECPDTSLPRGVAFHDSFGVGVFRWLNEHFRRLACLWHDDFHPALVLRERPEVVIQELVEHKLGYVVPNDIEDSGE
jgi:hypothetical protein